MKIIIGLGNIGSEYVGTRHNFGFFAVEHLANRFDAAWKNKSKFHAEIAEINIDGEKVLFVKPTTFYNLSGTTVRAICDFFNASNDDVLVIHDDMALPTGTLRSRIDGSDAGNNGIKNIIENIGEHFARLRIGSGREQDTNGNTLPDSDHRDFVLSKPTKTELEKIQSILPYIEQTTGDFIAGNFAITSKNI